jgi:DUF971 family protein
MPYLEPLAIEADDKLNRLFIEWSDGHTTEHDIEHLRWLCPCAECKGEWGDPGKLAYTKELTPQQTELTDVHPVGRYGLTPVWADGHSTGIYTYEYLRKNCECPACLAKRALEEAAATP